MSFTRKCQHIVLHQYQTGVYIREIEKPKVSGNSAKSLLRRVDLPVPEGPDTTTGRYLCTTLCQSFLSCSANYFVPEDVAMADMRACG